jgi:hypothetical protein
LRIFTPGEHFSDSNKPKLKMGGSGWVLDRDWKEMVKAF